MCQGPIGKGGRNPQEENNKANQGGGLLMVIFVGWAWGKGRAVSAVEAEGQRFALREHWFALVRWILPAALAYILYSGLVS